jgi:hypothetical protein
MPASPSRRIRLFAVALVAATAGVFTYILVRPFVPNPQPHVRVLPYPHHVPKTPGGVSLRFAMVQDVLTERYPRHGRAYYQERNRQAREDLARIPPGITWDALSDDLAAGLDQLGDHDAAVKVMRDKLASQADRGVAESGMYTTYVNLGTFLVHANLRAAETGEAAARKHVDEGLERIHKAIEVKPDAHFGREKWQIQYVDFLLMAIDKPASLRDFDFIGNRLDAEIDPTARRAFVGLWVGVEGGLGGVGWFMANRIEHGQIKRGEVEEFIQLVGAEKGWPVELFPLPREHVPFDEPVLGIIGTWRESGPDPHFALCLGETMLRVGQRYLAWTAFERASRLADQFWPDPALQEFLRTHCRKRQEMIESQLPANEVANLRPQFDAELAYGQRYQQEYADYEAEQIAAGRTLEDEHFYDTFNVGRPPIASPVGPEDELRVVSESEEMMLAITPGPRAGYAALGMGVGAVAMAVWLRRYSAR